jgi:CRP/FNR family transcriptional regulator
MPSKTAVPPVRGTALPSVKPRDLPFIDAASEDYVAQFVRERSFERGEVIFAQGDDPDGIYRLVAGRVKLARLHEVGGEIAEKVIAVFGAGDTFGGTSVFDPGPRTATAVAMTPCRARFLNCRDVEHLLAAEPTFARALLVRFSRRLRAAYLADGPLPLSDVNSKVARAIVRLTAQFGQPRPDGSVWVPHGLTQTELAAMVGSSRGSVNRALDGFESRGLVSVRTKALTVLDLPRLRVRAGEGDEGDGAGRTPASAA